MHRLLILVTLTIVGLTTAQDARASFPDRFVKLMVAFPAGGSLDIVARILAERMKAGLGQPVVVENKIGASGNIAAQSVVSADADGYTVLMSTSVLAINPWLAPTRFDPVKDLVAVTRPASAAYVLVVRASFPAKTLAEFVALAKAQPGKLTCSTYGVGSPPHLALELLKQEAGIDVVHAPYRGFGQALPDLTTGGLSCSVDTPANVEKHVQAGTLRALAVTGSSPLDLFPTAVTMASLYPEVMVEGWQGIFVPASTPRPVLDRLNAEFVKVIRDPEVGDRLRSLGFVPIGDTSDEATAVFKKDYERFGPIIRSLSPGAK